MNQKNTRGTPSPGFLELIGPTSVIRQRGSAKTTRLRWGGLRIIHHHHYYFALRIKSLIVIPLFFRSRDAVTHEYHRRIHIDGFLRRPRPIDDVTTKTRYPGTLALEGKGAGGECFEAGNFHRLTVACSIERLEAYELTLSLEITNGQFSPAFSRASTFQKIIAKKFNMGLKHLRVDGEMGLLRHQQTAQSKD